MISGAALAGQIGNFYVAGYVTWGSSTFRHYWGGSLIVNNHVHIE